MVDTDVYIETDDIKYRFAGVSCKWVDVSQNKRMTDKMKWRRNHHSTEKKKRETNEQWQRHTHTHKCTNVVKCSIQWDANGKKPGRKEEKSSKHYIQIHARKYCSLHFGALQTVPTIYHFKFCSAMCVVGSFISVRNNTLSCSSGSTSRFLYKTGEKVENQWSKHRMCCSLSIRDIWIEEMIPITVLACICVYIVWLGFELQWHKCEFWKWKPSFYVHFFFLFNFFQF